MKQRLIIISLLILLGLSARFLPHAPNFSPLGSIFLFTGLYLNKKYDWLIPLSIMFISDLFIGFYNWPIMVSVYLGLLIMFILGRLNHQKKFKWIFTSSFLGSVLFFILTNFSVWLFSNMYSLNLIGLKQCFIMALPFFKNTLSGNLLYTLILIGLIQLINNHQTKPKIYAQKINS